MITVGVCRVLSDSYTSLSDHSCESVLCNVSVWILVKLLFTFLSFLSV